MGLYLLCSDAFLILFYILLHTSVQEVFFCLFVGEFVNKILQLQVQLTIQDRAVQEEEEGESLSDQLEKLLAKYEDSETLQDFFWEGTFVVNVLISKQRGKR